MLFTENEKRIIRKLLKYSCHYNFGRGFFYDWIYEQEDDGVYFYYEDSLDDKYYIFLRKPLYDEETNKMFFNKIEAINLISKLIDLKYLTPVKLKSNYHYYCLWGYPANSYCDNLKDKMIVEFMPSGQTKEYIDRSNFKLHLSDNTIRDGFKFSFINRNMIDFMEGFVYVHPELKELADNDFKTSEEIFREKELDNAKKSLKKTNWSIGVAVASLIISTLTLCFMFFGCNSSKITNLEKDTAYTCLISEEIK